MELGNNDGQLYRSTGPSYDMGITHIPDSNLTVRETCQGLNFKDASDKNQTYQKAVVAFRSVHYDKCAG